MQGPGLFMITLYSLLAGVLGTGGGGLLAYYFPRPNRKVFSMILGFAAGIMLAIAFLELLEESLALGDTLLAVIGLVLGVGIFLWLDNTFPHNHPVRGLDGQQGRYVKKGYLIAGGIALHNLPEGLAIGAGFAASPELGLGLAFIIALHNIPEGLAVAMPLKVAGKKEQGLWISFLAGVPMAIGGFIGGLIGNISLALLSLSLAFAAGAMLYIVCDELIPDAYENSPDHYPIVGILVGVIIGLLIISL